MSGVCTTVTTQVQVPAVGGCNQTNVLTLCLGTFTVTTGNTELELVRGAQTTVTVLELDCHAGRVLNAEAAPGRTHAGLHVTQGLTVCLTGLEASIHQALPNVGQLLQASTEHTDTLSTGNLHVQAELFSDLCDDAQLLSGNLTCGNTRNDGVGTVLLHVRQCTVVGLLQATATSVQNVGVAEGGENRCNGRLTDCTAVAAMTEACQHGVEVIQAGQAHSLSQLSTGEVEVLTQCLGDGQTHLLHLLFQSLLQHRNTGTTLGTCGGAGLQGCNIVVAVNDSLADSTEADVVAGTQDCVVGKFGIGDAVAAASCGQVNVRLSGQFATEQGLQGVEGSGVTNEHATQQGLCVAAGHNLLVHAACGVCEQNLEAALGGAAAVTEASHLNAGELQLGCDVELFNLSFFVVVEQVSCHSVSHSVSRCDQTPGAAQYAGDLTDSPNVLVGGVACVVDENTAALAQCQVGVACQLVVGANTGTEDHHVGGQGADFCILGGRICDGDGDDVAVSILVDAGDVHAGLNLNASCLNLGVHGVTATLVNLNGKQPGSHI